MNEHKMHETMYEKMNIEKHRVCQIITSQVFEETLHVVLNE